MAQTAVSLVKCLDYSAENVSAAVAQSLQHLGGIEKFIKPGQKVLIKPNLLQSALPEKGCTTHPEIIRALIKQVKQAGGIPYVGDSPGLDSPRKAAEGCGILKVMDEEGACFIDFNDAGQIGEINLPAGRILKTVRFVKAVLEMDVVISASKLKTHGFTGLTAAVKNLFGCVPGLSKAQCHVRFARKSDFDLMLLDVLRLVRPALNIVDAVVAMEGEGGPTAGALRPMNLVVAGEDAVAVDSVCAALTGRQPQDFGFLRAAAQIGEGETNLENIQILGEPLGENIHKDFRHISVARETMFPNWVPDFVRNFLRLYFVDRPRLIKSKCKKCGACKKVCAAGAITLVGGCPRFNYAKCISCFCCQEMCKYAALKIQKSLLTRAIFAVGRLFGGLGA